MKQGKKMKQKKNTYFHRTQKLFAKLMKAFATPPDLTVSEWADEYRFL